MSEQHYVRQVKKQGKRGTWRVLCMVMTGAYGVVLSRHVNSPSYLEPSGIMTNVHEDISRLEVP
jgi:hypothetical protein